MINVRYPLKSQTGFIVGYTLFGIALVALATGLMAVMYKQNSEHRVFEQQREVLIADALLVRNTIRLCARTYPGGLNGDDRTAYMEFPATGNGMVADLKCPGAPSDAQGNAVSIWQRTYSGSIADKAPPARKGLSEWKYVNHKAADGTLQLFVYVDSLSTERSMGGELINSVANNWKLKNYFFAVSATDARGQTVRRLISTPLAD